MRNLILGCKRKQKNSTWRPDTEDTQVEETEDEVYCSATSRSRKEVQDKRGRIALMKDSERLCMQSAIPQGVGNRVRKTKVLLIFPSLKMAASSQLAKQMRSINSTSYAYREQKFQDD